jgi:hypothetical protein
MGFDKGVRLRYRGNRQVNSFNRHGCHHMFDLQYLSDTFPPELIPVTVRVAERDAFNVKIFLDHLGLERSHTQRLPLDFFRILASGIRLLLWESRGVIRFLPYTFPSAMSVITELFRQLNQPDRWPTDLPGRVFHCFLESFCWQVYLKDGIEIVVDNLDVELATSSVAKFLLACISRVN